MLFGGFSEVGESRARVAYADNTLKFDFGLPSYDDPQQSLYQSQLVGLEQQWSKWDSNPSSPDYA